MTTFILGQKLMSVKLDKNEMIKVNCLQTNVIGEKHKIIKSLQKIINETSQTCRLCLRPGSKKIFSDHSSEIAANINYVTGIVITEIDGLPQYICSNCESTVQAAAQLKQVAETTQWRLKQELELINETEFDDMPKKLHGGYFNMKESTIVREWVCKKCSKIFHNEVEWTEHESMPSCRRRNKCYMCEICGRELKSLFLLKRHRLIHTDQPGEFECSFCSYRARTKYAVKIHERWHTGDRPSQCTICHKSFSNAANLWSHNRRHLPPKYHCDVCGKSFRFKELLIDHMATQHSNDKRFHCYSCEKAFPTRKKTLRHERRVHNRPHMRELEKAFLKVTD